MRPIASPGDSKQAAVLQLVLNTNARYTRLAVHVRPIYLVVPQLSVLATYLDPNDSWKVERPFYSPRNTFCLELDVVSALAQLSYRLV